NAIGSRPGVLVNFSPTDSIDARVAAFSSDRSIADFDLDGFAGELGFQVGNLILRGTYVSARDGGTNDGPPEIFSFDRGDGDFGIESDDREESFGFNAEYFVPGVNIGFFGRYGRYENLDAEFSGETFSGGFNVLDVFTPNDRLGLAYGRALSSDEEREGDNPDVLELFYDVPLLSNPSTRLGVTLQQRNEFSETVAGIRFRTNFDILR
ncbi:MAG: porin, partial [Cyanobacteria bacterium J06627_8]